LNPGAAGTLLADELVRVPALAVVFERLDDTVFAMDHQIRRTTIQGTVDGDRTGVEPDGCSTDHI
jgi:hypothetical protein